MELQHLPVLKGEVQRYLNLNSGDTVLDATLGLGGHALDILKKIGKRGKLYAIEQDLRNLQEAKKRLKSFESQIVYIHDNFRYLKSRVTEEVDAILFDLGLSSAHVDEASRGFSFLKDGPLDMRFDQRQELTAQVVLNTYSEHDLADIFWNYGEERMSKKASRLIVERRSKKLFESTVELANFLEQILPRQHAKKVHPATKIFQALRIEVNDELNALKEALDQAMHVLKIGGRIVIISYHSLEDRIVKQFFKALLQPKIESIYSTYGEPFVAALTKKPVIPTEIEISTNPRSRSAKLRAYKKIK